MDTAAYKQFTTTAADLAKTFVEGQIQFFDTVATTAKGTPAATFFDAAAKMQRATLQSFESLSDTIAKAPGKAAPKTVAPKSAKVAKKAVANANDTLTQASPEKAVAPAKAKPVAKKAAKPVKSSNAAALNDDLTAVTGIGPSTMKKMQAAGIRTIEDLAKTSKKDLTDLVEAANVRLLKHTPADWIANAKALVKSAKAA